LERFRVKHITGLDPVVETGSREENPSKQQSGASVLVQSEPKLAPNLPRWYNAPRNREPSMKFLRAGALIALLTGPAYAQSLPDINIIPDTTRIKTPQEIEQDKINDKAYKESLRKIPDGKASTDPWGSVRGADAPKPAKTAPAGPRTKTGSTAN
jgi:hypothetical protein